MSLRQTLIGLAVMVAGCGRAAPPASVALPSPGKAVLELQIVAEPKDGVSAEPADPGTYVTPVMERLDYANLPDIVVWLEPVNGSPTGATGLAPVPVDVDPRQAAGGVAAAVTVGQKIVLHNTSSMAADFYSVSDGNDFDLGQIAPGATASYTVKSIGLIDVLTDSVRDPIVRIYAAPTSRVQLTAAGKTVEFRDLPPGQYKAITWHPRLPGSELPIVLSADQITTATAKVGVNDLPKIASH